MRSSSNGKANVIVLLLAVFFAVLIILPTPSKATYHNRYLGSRHRAKDPHYHLKPAHAHGKFKPGPWKDAHATFYGGSDGTDTRGGACGFEDTVDHGYGLMTAALSTSMFEDGKRCGSCYEIKCSINDPKACKPGHKSIVVTGTNLCPPNYAQSSDAGGWCNPPREHFDLSQPAYLQIAEYSAGIVPVTYRRIPCKRQGGIRFTVTGSRYYTEVLVWNVAGSGDVHGLLVKGVKQQWTPLVHVWGQKWKTDVDLVGQSLTFRVLNGDGRRSTSWHITPNDWQYGQTYVGKNFLS